MKHTITLFIIIALVAVSSSFGQSVTIDIRNKDKTTRKKMTLINAATIARIGINIAMNTSVASSIGHYKEQLKRNYTRYNNDDLFSSKIQGLNLGITTIATESIAHTKLPYMTTNKKEYIRKVSLDKTVLFFLINIDHTVIKNGDRLEIYRLRNELIKLYSHNDKIARQLMLLPVAAYAIENKTELFKLLKAIDIFL